MECIEQDRTFNSLIKTLTGIGFQPFIVDVPLLAKSLNPVKDRFVYQYPVRNIVRAAVAYVIDVIMVEQF